MSFRCGKCSEQVEPNIRPVKVVVEKRHKDYVGGGHGWEIGKELGLCIPCANNSGEPVWTAAAPAVVAGPMPGFGRR